MKNFNHDKHRKMLSSRPKVTVNFSDIIVYRKEHKMALNNPPTDLLEMAEKLKSTNASTVNNAITVIQTFDGKYRLLSGFKGYFLSQQLELEQVKVVIKRKEKPRKPKAFSIQLDEITIPTAFEETKNLINIRKLDRAANELLGNRLKPITLNKHNMLIDGYSRYIVAKNYDLETVKVIYK